MSCVMLSPLVSVIVPVYNVEKYLARCLDSVVGQTYENLEIILVNDGSTDGSGEICRQYAQSDPRIRVLTQENRGPSAARNTGLNHMKGDYVVFVDSDDYIAPHLVETLLSKALEYDVPLAVCNYLEVEDGDDHAVWDMAAWGQVNLCTKMTRDEVFDTIGKADNVTFVVAFGKIYKKRMFEELRYPVGRKHEDEFIFPEIYAQADEICHVNLGLYAYRQSLNSITRANGVNRVHMKDIIDMRLDRLAFFERYGVRKYSLRTERQLVSDLALYWIDSGSREKAKQYIKETETKVCQLTGRKLFSCRWVIFKVSPELYWAARNCYRRARDLIRSLKHKRFMR